MVDIYSLQYLEFSQEIAFMLLMQYAYQKGGHIEEWERCTYTLKSLWLWYLDLVDPI